MLPSHSAHVLKLHTYIIRFFLFDGDTILMKVVFHDLLSVVKNLNEQLKISNSLTYTAR